jgi:glycosyltransferase involved in cell wall biosynthesis
MVPPGTTLDVVGTVIDSRNFDLSGYARTDFFKEPNEPRPAPMVEDPKTPIRISIDGVLYVSIFTPFDPRKNWTDVLGGFCWAFRDTEDATLICKVVCTYQEGGRALGRMLQHLYRHTPFKCRIVLICGFLGEEGYNRLVAAASYVVSAALCEGQCLPLTELMACGKPAVAPGHTGLADYIDPENSFVIRSSSEPTGWPHDPRHAFRTLRQRIDFQSLLDAYAASYRVAKSEPVRYASMSTAAHQALRHHCSRAGAAERLRKILATQARPPEREHRFGRIKPRFDAPWIVETSIQ